MKKIKAFVWLLIMVGLIGGGVYNLYKHFSGASEEENRTKIENYKKLVEEGESALVLFDSVYSEKRIKGVAFSKEIEYQYEVAGKMYNGTLTFKEDNFSPVMEVKYLKSNPEIHAFNPQQALNDSVANKGSKNNLWFGLGAILIGLIGAYINFNKLKSKAE